MVLVLNGRFPAAQLSSAQQEYSTLGAVSSHLYVLELADLGMVRGDPDDAGMYAEALLTIGISYVVLFHGAPFKPQFLLLNWLACLFASSIETTEPQNSAH